MSNKTLPFALLALLVSGPVRADEPAPAQSSPLKALAHTAAEQRVTEMRLQLAQKEAEIAKLKKPEAAAATAPPEDAPKKPPARPVVVHEIGGTGGHLMAVFRLADGSLRSFTPGETVPGFGRIASITPEGVVDASGHSHAVTDRMN